MKTYTVGLVLAATLLVVASVGFGIAQASGNQMDQQVLSYEGAGKIDQGASSTPYTEDRPVVTGSDDMQLRNPVEAGRLPAENDLDHSDVPIEGNTHQYWGSDSPSN